MAELVNTYSFPSFRRILLNKLYRALTLYSSMNLPYVIPDYVYLTNV